MAQDIIENNHLADSKKAVEHEGMQKKEAL